MVSASYGGCAVRVMFVSQGATGIRVDNGTGFSPKGATIGSILRRFTSSDSLAMLAAMRGTASARSTVTLATVEARAFAA